MTNFAQSWREVFRASTVMLRKLWRKLLVSCWRRRKRIFHLSHFSLVIICFSCCALNEAESSVTSTDYNWVSTAQATDYNLTLSTLSATLFIPEDKQKLWRQTARKRSSQKTNNGKVRNGLGRKHGKVQQNVEWHVWWCAWSNIDSWTCENGKVVGFCRYRPKRQKLTNCSLIKLKLLFRLFRLIDRH